MLDPFGLRHAADAIATLAAFGRSQAMIEFNPDGTVITANDNFLGLMGYKLSEIKGRRHRIFLDPREVETAEYEAFWTRLRAGDFSLAQFKRIAKDGSEVWIEASYNPVLDSHGKVTKVVKIATDVTAQKRVFADMSGKIAAIDKSQAVIEFATDGTILAANQNFLAAMGYTIDEIKGHHRMFVEPAFAGSAEYAAFWKNLRAGVFQAGQFRRFGKGGRVVWIEAAYNLVLDLNGQPCKVVKYATDITARVTELAGLKSTMDRRFEEIGTALCRSTEEAERAAEVLQESTRTVHGVAAGAEEMATTVREITQMMIKSRVATDTANSQMHAADDATQRLAVASDAMGGIVNLIRNIAGQINLLSLNATIESARAGDAGKGFAVVAGEVKTLALQASDATDKITREIAVLQRLATEVVGALKQIGGSIDEVGQYVRATADSVEEQSKVTQSISADLNRVANTVSAINGNMGAIGGAMQQVTTAVSSTRDAARVLVR